MGPEQDQGMNLSVDLATGMASGLGSSLSSDLATGPGGDLTMGAIMSGLVLGLLGMVMLMKGKRDSDPLVLIGGIIISALPVLVHTIWLDWTIVGAILAGIVLFRKMG